MRKRTVLSILLLLFACSSMLVGYVFASANVNYLLAIEDSYYHFSSIAYSPDGRYIVVEPAPAIYDAATGESTVILSGQDNIGAPSFSVDGERLLTVGVGFNDYWVRVWDSRTGVEQLIIETNSNAADFSPDGSQIVSSNANTIQVWDATTGAKRFEIDVTNGSLAQFSPDGQRIVSAGTDGVVHVWDAQTGEELLEFAGHDDKIWEFLLSPDGSQIVTIAFADPRVHIWDAVTGRKVQELRDWRIKHFSGIGMSPDGKYIAGLGRQGGLAVWNVATRRTVRFYPSLLSESYYGGARDVEFSPSGRHVAVAGDSQIQIIEADFLSQISPHN